MKLLEIKKFPVIKTFRDKNTKVVHIKDAKYETDVPERARELQTLGFIGNEIFEESKVSADIDEESDDGLKHVGGGYWELPNGERVRGKDNALKVLEALAEDGDGVGKEPKDE